MVRQEQEEREREEEKEGRTTAGASQSTSKHDRAGTRSHHLIAIPLNFFYGNRIQQGRQSRTPPAIHRRRGRLTGGLSCIH